MQTFRQQLDFLADAGYATPTLAELARAPVGISEARTVAITFDDGYADNLDACAELHQRGMRASWFVVAGSVGREPTWHEAESGRPSGRLLNALELRAMHASGMEIGSHSMSHARLTQLDDEPLRRELHDSRTTLEQLLGQPVTSFAYPYGDWDARCAHAVAASDYQAACTTRTGWALRDDDPYRMRRLTVFNSDTPAMLVRKLALGSHNIGWHHVVRYAVHTLRNV